MVLKPVQAYAFGSYRLEVSTQQLQRDGEVIPLTPKAYQMLLALIERRDRVVDKAELMQVVWQDSFVEQANLTQTIFVLRKTLGEQAHGKPFIDTIPRRGYRFVADVREEHAMPPSATDRPARRRTRVFAIAGVVIAAGALWIASAWFRGAGAGTTPSIQSLVVLPFGDLSPDGARDFLAESLNDALITNLGQISGLRVISRTSAMTYANTGKTVPQIARELRVDGVVEGTIHRSAGRVRLNLKLIHASSDRTLWAYAYERDPDGLLALHNEIARTIVSHTAVPLTPQERDRLAETPRVIPKVYEAYLKGRYFWSRRSEPDMRQAIEHFEDAIRHDPTYAPAYAGLADSYAVYESYGWPLPGGDAWARAVASADRALALDPRLADGHTSRARIALNYELDWAGAERGYRRALELNPGYAIARHWYGYYLLLTGRYTEGEAELRRALELDPLSPIVNANVGMAAYFDRRFDAAIAHWRQALEMHRNYRLLHNYLASAYLGKQMYAEAIAELEKGMALSGAGSWERALLAYAYGRMGRVQDARTLLADVRREGDTAAYDLAIVYVGLGDADQAFAWLDRAVDARMGAFNEVNADPIFDPLRGDPRFSVLLRRMGLPNGAVGPRLATRIPPSP